MLMSSQNKSRGDTLIEVLFAITIFSLVAVGSISIMNQGTATSQRALEITLVRQEIDAQAETLRFLNASFIADYQSGATSYTGPAEQWRLIQNSTILTPSSLNTGSATCPSPQPGSFILDTRNAIFVPAAPNKLNPPKTFSQVRFDLVSGQVSSAEGIWIEAVRSATSPGYQSNAGYIDFHIRACWDSPGQSVPVTIGTIVRLYEPRG